MSVHQFPDDLSLDIESNIEKIKEIMERYVKAKDNKERKELILNASFLIEKIIFYIQLDKGVENIATYTYKEKNVEKSSDIRSLLNFDHKRIDMKNLFAIREFIVREYKKYKTS